MRDTQGFWAPQPVASIRYCTGTIQRDFTCVSLLPFPSLHFQHFSENIQYSTHSLIPKPRPTHQKIPNTPSLPLLLPCMPTDSCPPSFTQTRLNITSHSRWMGRAGAEVRRGQLYRIARHVIHSTSIPWLPPTHSLKYPWSSFFHAW